MNVFFLYAISFVLVVSKLENFTIGWLSVYKVSVTIKNHLTVILELSFV